VKLVSLLFGAIAALVLAGRADAAVLYGSTAAGAAGELYILNPATGAVVQDVGPLNDAGSVNYPITGLAFNPIDGVLYGSTGNANAATEARLVRINPATGLVTPVGSFNAGPTNTTGTPATMADIAFDSAGNLYGVGSIGGPQLYSINTATGQATVIGGTGLTSTTGGGLAISSGGVFYGTPTSTRFGTYNSSTGAFTNIVNPIKPLGGAYAALAFDGSTLYGLNLGSPASIPVHLVTIVPGTGAVTDLGAGVGFLDGMAFTVPEPGAMTLLAGATSAFLLRRGRRATRA
jgi:hypothetical protein